VAEQLLGPAKPLLEALEARLGREIEVRARGGLHQEQFEVTALGEATPAPFQVPWLGGNGSTPKESLASVPAGPVPEGPAAEAPAAEPQPSPKLATSAASVELAASPAGPELAAQPVDAEGESPILGRFLEET
jgi:hypothetical protein